MTQVAEQTFTESSLQNFSAAEAAANSNPFSAGQFRPGARGGDACRSEGLEEIAARVGWHVRP